MTYNFRNIVICISLVFFILGLGGCSTKEKNKWMIEGKEVILNQAEGTITYDNEVYKYSKSNNAIEITYPNQMTYTETNKNSGTSVSTWSADPSLAAGFIDITSYGYLSERVIIDTVLKYSSEIDPNSGNSLSGRSPLLGLFIILIGAIVVAFPKASWYLNYGWRYKDSKPSDVAIVVQRVSGGIAIVVGLILIIGS